MRITDDVRRYAEEQGLTTEAAIEAGMQAKAGEFREQGGELYVPAAP
jgi:phosphomethylpyrimidine synthase